MSHRGRRDMSAERIVKDLQARLVALKGQYARMERNNPNLSYAWLCKFANNPNPNPRRDKIDSLDAAVIDAEKWAK